MRRSRPRRRHRHGDNRPNLSGDPRPVGTEGAPEGPQRAPEDPSAPQTLERRSVRQFPRIALSLGRQYFNANRASDPTWTDKLCTTTVKGAGGNYQVSLDFNHVAENRQLPAKCDCPAYARGVLCKHLWAAILQVDKATPLETMPESGPLKLVHSVPRSQRNQNQQNGQQPQARRGRGDGPRPLPHYARVDAGSWQDRLNQLQGLGAAPTGRGHTTRASAFFVISASETSATGKLVVDLWTRIRSMNGELGPLRPNRVSGTDFSQFENARDQEILSLLTRSCDPQFFAPFGRSSGNTSSRFKIDPLLEPHFITSMTSAGKLFLSRAHTGAPESENPIRLDRGQAWEFQLKIEASGTENYRLEGILRRDGELKSITDPLAILRSGFLLFDDRIGRFADPRHAQWAATLRMAEFHVPKAQGDTLLTRILTDSASPKLTWPDDMGWTLTDIEPRPKGIFRPLGNDPSTGRMTLTVSFDYAGREIALAESEMSVVDVDKKTVYRRNQEFEEKTLLQALEILRDPQGTGSVPLSDMHRAANELCQAGWSIFIESQELHIAETFSMNVNSSTDWFDLKLEADFGEMGVSHTELLKALESKSGLVKLNDGSLGMLPQDWIEKYASISQFGEKTDEGAFRFNRSQGLMLNAVLTDDEHLKADKKFLSFRDRIREFEGVKAAKAPAGFKGKLRNYQKEGLTWLQFLEEFETGGILADDMGLGKTIQILAFLLARSKTSKLPNLVVTPKSLAFNWMDEASKFVPGLKVVRYAGAGREDKLPELKDADLVVTTYGTLRTDIEILEKIEFDVAIVDEAQAIKNPKAQVAAACKRLRARHKLALTGTPIENSINDLLSILEFTNPGLLSFSQDKELGSDTQSALARMLKPFMLRRTKEKVLTELPDKSEQVLFCEMSADERQFYTAIRDKYRASIAEKVEKSGLGRSKLHVLEALLRLRQAACHSGLVDPDRKNEPSAKLQLLINHIQEVTQEGHKALVFSQFTSLLALVRTRLDAEGITYEYLDGQTQDRKSPVERFQSDPKCPVFLISLKAGGTGLNLTAADYVFILDPWWNPAVEAQAIGRAHRMGQTQKVFAYRMIARGTVEEKILELQKTKKELAESIISEDQDFMKKLSKEDLELLLT